MVYLHSIALARWIDIRTEDLRNFLNSIKDGDFSHIVLVTNRWEEVDQKHGEGRELDLYHRLWKAFITEGSSILRLGQTQASALRILRLLISGDRLKLLKSQREPDDEPCSTPQLRTAQAFIEISLEQKERRERLLKSQREPWSIAQMETTQAFIENSPEQKERRERHRKELLKEIQAATEDIEHRTEKQSGEKPAPIRTKDKTVSRTVTQETPDLQTQINLEMEERIDPIESFHVKQPKIEQPKIEQHKVKLKNKPHDSSDGEYSPDSLKSNLARNQNRSRAGVTITGEREVRTKNAEIKSSSHQVRLMHQNRVTTREEIYQSSFYELRSRLRSKKTSISDEELSKQMLIELELLRDLKEQKDRPISSHDINILELRDIETIEDVIKRHQLFAQYPISNDLWLHSRLIFCWRLGIVVYRNICRAQAASLVNDFLSVLALTNPESYEGSCIVDLKRIRIREIYNLLKSLADCFRCGLTKFPANRNIMRFARYFDRFQRDTEYLVANMY